MFHGPAARGFLVVLFFASLGGSTWVMISDRQVIPGFLLMCDPSTSVFSSWFPFLQRMLLLAVLNHFKFIVLRRHLLMNVCIIFSIFLVNSTIRSPRFKVILVAKTDTSTQMQNMVITYLTNNSYSTLCGVPCHNGVKLWLERKVKSMLSAQVLRRVLYIYDPTKTNGSLMESDAVQPAC